MPDENPSDPDNPTYYWVPMNPADTEPPDGPDTADANGNDVPYRLDRWNNSFEWAGGAFVFSGGVTSYAAGWFSASVSDSDGDSIPDSVDLEPGTFNPPDPGEITMSWWDGGTFPLNNEVVTYQPGSYPNPDSLNPAADADGDGIPNFVDSYPNDWGNNSPDAVWWEGGSFIIDSSERIFPGRWFIGWSDIDGDSIPDELDPYPNEYFNNTPGFFWPPYDGNGQSQTWTYTMGMDNHIVSFTTTAYWAEWTDTDDDGIPNIADPYPEEKLNRGDQDGDGIPDSVEVAYSPQLNPNDPADAATIRYINGRTDGLTWKQAYDYGHLDSLFDDGTDHDGDGMNDHYEIVNGLDPASPLDSVVAPIGELSEGTEPTMNDWVLNIEKARAWWPLATPLESDDDYLAVTGHSSGEGLNHDYLKSVAENDWDGDGVSNVDEVKLGTDLRSVGSRPSDDQLIDAFLSGNPNLSTTTRIHFLELFTTSGRDTDSDGIPDLVEKRIGLSWTDETDASQQYPDNSGRTWKEVYEAGEFDLIRAFAQSVPFTPGAPVTITLEGSSFYPASLSYSIGPGTGPSHGTLSGVSGNQVTYTPGQGSSLSDSFAFRVTATSSHGTFSATATVGLAVPPPPTVTANDDSFTILAGKTKDDIELSAVSSAGLTLTYALSGPAPTKGTVSLKGQEICQSRYPSQDTGPTPRSE